MALSFQRRGPPNQHLGRAAFLQQNLTCEKAEAAMLFTDRTFLTTRDLEDLDPRVADIARIEGVDIPRILARTQVECGNIIQAESRGFNSAYGSGISGGHLANVMNTGGNSDNRSRVDMERVVVSGPTPLHRTALFNWVAWRSIAELFLAAANRKDKASKYFELHESAIKSAEHRKRILEASGIPLVDVPLPCPGAEYWRGAGAWSDSNVDSVASGAAAEQTCYVAITWLGAAYVSPTAKGNSESAPSAVIQFTIPASNLLRVSIASLTPPTGGYTGHRTGVALPTIPATRWNVYVGPNEDTLYLQNASPIAIATQTYTLAAAPVFSGSVADSGQLPRINFSLDQTITRG